jgi:hypothetical protein
MKVHLSAVTFFLLAGALTCGAADNDTEWIANDIRVIETMPGQVGVADTRLEIGANGDARVTVDLSDDEAHTKGTILLITGRWMLTEGITSTRGAEIDLMDIAALNSQLVLALLRAAVPGGPRVSELPQAVSLAEKATPIRVNTSSASGEYGAPWSLEGTVSTPVMAGVTDYDLRFMFTGESGTVTTRLKGSIGNLTAPVSIPDSMPIAGWAIHKIGPYQGQTSNGLTLDYGAQPSSPKVSTIGELRKLK